MSINMDSVDPATEFKEIKEMVGEGVTPSTLFKQVLTLVKKRGVKRATTTKFINEVVSGMSVYSENEIKSLMKIFQIKLNELIELDNYILNIYAECDEFTCEGSEKLSIKNRDYILGISTLINDLERKLTPVQMVSSNNPHIETSFSGLKLPEFQLPEFDGKHADFDRFIKILEEIMDMEHYNKFDRYSCLLQQLKGPAKILIQKSPEADLDYDMAKSILINAFSNKTLQQFSIIDKLSKLKLTNDFYSWIRDARFIEAQFNSLNITTEILLQYFLWNGLPEQYKTQYINMTNNTYPNLDEILKHSFEIQNRMKECGFVNKNKEINSKINSNLYTNQNTTVFEKKTVALASNIDATQKQNTSTKAPKRTSGCSICQALKTSDYMQHKLFYCPNFQTPETKLQKIKELGGCTKCGYLNHKVENCKFKFGKKCANCNGWHSSFLCLRKQNRPTITQKNENKNTINNKNRNNTQAETSTNVVELNVIPFENPSSEQLEFFSVQIISANVM